MSRYRKTRAGRCIKMENWNSRKKKSLSKFRQTEREVFAMANRKLTSAIKARITIITLIVLSDLFLLPWLLKFLVLLMQRLAVNPALIATVPSEWFAFGLLRSIGALFVDAKLRALYLVMQLPVIALVIGIAWDADRMKKRNRINDGVGGPEPAGAGQHGTSRWQDKREMDKTTDVWYGTDELKKGGIVFGMEPSGHTEKIWSNFDDLHTLIIGATRSGKSRKIILPSIWGLAKAGESMVIGDPKGELYIAAKEHLEKEGYNVVALNLREPLKGNQWNMLDIVNKAVDEGDVPRAAELSWDIANAITNQKPQTSSEPIWTNGEESTIAALILLTVLNSQFKFQRHMTTAYYLLAEYGQPLDDESIPLLDYIKTLDVRHPAKSAFATASIAPYKTRASFFTTALADLRLFSDPNISDMTSKQDHDLKSIGIDKTAVFLIVPDEKSTRNVLATLYIDQVYQSMVDLANKKGGRIPRRVNFILDEFGNLPPIPNFDKKLTVAGGRGMRFTVAIQDIAQIKKLYKDSAQTITGNCHNWIYIKTADVETAKLISEKTGKYTVETENSSSSVQSKGHSTSQGVGLTGRPLLMPDEILRWDTNQSLVLPISYFPARYPLPDLSQWSANVDFGFVSPSKDRDGDMRANASLIEQRWLNHCKREIERVSIWLPDLICEAPTKSTPPPVRQAAPAEAPKPTQEREPVPVGAAAIAGETKGARLDDILCASAEKDAADDDEDFL